MPSPIDSSIIKKEAAQLGFSACGIARAEAVAENAAMQFKQNIAKGFNADMLYLENNMEKRMNPKLLLEGAETVVSLALNYYPKEHLSPHGFAFARYAYGKDYHIVIKELLYKLLSSLKSIYPELEGRAFCDTAPMLEKYWAMQSGIGWQGKNTQIIIPNAGSFFFLGELVLTSKASAYDSPMKSHCGNCHKCLDACPTGALSSDACGLDARRCLSYLTIEQRGEIPKVYAEKMGNCIYGCDRCLEACPHNKFATPTEMADFNPSILFREMEKKDWNALSIESYRQLFRNSAIKRAKYEGLLRNIRAAQDEA